MEIVFRDVAADKPNLDRYWQLVDHFKIQKPGLPAFYVGGQFESGWDVEKTPTWIDEALTVEVFVREGCSRCQAAHPVLFERLPKRYPGYRFVERDIVKSTDAGRRLEELTARYRTQAVSVPAVHMNGRLIVGFRDAETSFREWDKVLRTGTIVCSRDKAVPRGQSPAAGMLAITMSRVKWQTSATEVISDDESPRPPSPPAEDRPATGAGPTFNSESTTSRGLPAETDFTARPRSDDPDAGAEVITLPVFGEVNWRDWGMPAFTVFVGLVDGFNPCAIWVLLFLLSVLVNLKDRRKILAVAGTFVVISGLAYLAFMSAWLSIFQLMGLMRPAQIALGLIGMAIGAIHVKDFFAFKKGVSLSIPESVKPGIYERVRKIISAKTLWTAIIGASALAVLVNVVELLCTAGLPAMYTGILTMQHYPTWLNYLYLLLYIAAYMFDDSLMVGTVVLTLGRHKLQERGGRVLKLISGVVILALGVLMIFKPEWLV